MIYLYLVLGVLAWGLLSSLAAGIIMGAERIKRRNQGR